MICHDVDAALPPGAEVQQCSLGSWRPSPGGEPDPTGFSEGHSRNLKHMKQMYLKKEIKKREKERKKERKKEGKKERKKERRKERKKATKTDGKKERKKERNI